tara:strand:- start:72 stop:305 length:234 start_codon:yes stop_codon:yes gene_type:complete
MKNKEQLLNKENWVQYLNLADDGGLTNNAKANDIVSKIKEAINYTPCCGDVVCGNCDGYGYTVDENGRRKDHCKECE